MSAVASATVAEAADAGATAAGDFATGARVSWYCHCPFGVTGVWTTGGRATNGWAAGSWTAGNSTGAGLGGLTALRGAVAVPVPGNCLQSL